MRLRTALTVVVTVFVASAMGALGAATAKDPFTVILQKGDVPAKAQYSSGAYGSNVERPLAKLGIQATGAYYHAAVKVSSTKAEEISGAVFVTGSTAQATKLYGLFVKEAEKRPNKTQPVQLPRYGDQQYARYFTGASNIELLVRKRATVWQLQVQGGGLLVLSKAKLTTELATYAAKQTKRVGAG